jgi:O-acetyl-ADP-ribose deacetylase (regulator of RNase III)
MKLNMIREVEGDILLTDADLIAHGIATRDHFDSGLALSLRDRWPSMVRDYRHFTHSNPLKAGDVWAWSGVNEGGGTRHIINLITQDMLDDGKASRPNKASLEHVAHSLKALAKHIKNNDIRSVALPRLATGVGAWNWADVKPLIQTHLADLGIPVLVYEVFRHGVKADEKLA